MVSIKWAQALYSSQLKAAEFWLELVHIFNQPTRKWLSVPLWSCKKEEPCTEVPGMGHLIDGRRRPEMGV